MKILFITRAYPPVLGGIEMQNYGIGEALSKITDVKIIANKKGKINLPLFLLSATLKSFFSLSRYDVVLFGDGVLSPLGVFLKIFYRKKKYISIIHGLDVTYAHKKSLLGKIYNLVNIPCHKKLDKLFMVGNETIAEAVKIGIPREKCVFIPNGLDIDEIARDCSRADLEKLLRIKLENKKIIFRGGRYVKHKGVEWFIRNVVPELPQNYLFVAAGAVVAKKTAGDESDYENCRLAARELNLNERVFLLANLSREDLKILFNACDLYVSPNIKVPGSMEGFGITAIEAGACKKVVLASDLEGLKDAIKNNENGFLIESGKAEAWIKKIIEVMENDNFRKEFGEYARQFVIENYGWEKIAKKYFEEITKIISNTRFPISNKMSSN